MSRARVMMAASMGGPKPVYFADGFERADGAIGGAWTVRSGTWTILSNQAKCTAVGNVTVPCAVNVDIAVELTLPVGASGMVVVRYVDNNNYVRLVIEQSTSWYLQKMLLGVPTIIVSGIAAYSNGMKLRLVACGTRFSCYYNDVYLNAGTIGDATLQTSAIVGMRNGLVANAIFDNFVAKELS